MDGHWVGQAESEGFTYNVRLTAMEGEVGVKVGNRIYLNDSMRRGMRPALRYDMRRCIGQIHYKCGLGSGNPAPKFTPNPNPNPDPNPNPSSSTII